MQYQLYTVNLSRLLIIPKRCQYFFFFFFYPQCIGITDGRSKPIRMAINAATATIQNVRVDHCRAHVFVAEEFLNRANIVTVLKKYSDLSEPSVSVMEMTS